MEEMEEQSGAAETVPTRQDAESPDNAAGNTVGNAAESIAEDSIAEDSPATEPVEEVAAEELLAGEPATPAPDDARLKAILEAIVYLTDEPLTMEQMAAALKQTRDKVSTLLAELVAEYDQPQHGLSIREVAGGFAMATKPEHHEEVRAFVKNLQPPMKLSLPSLETLAVIAYKQPITAPEIMEIRGVQGAGVLKTLLDRKLIAAAGRKNVIGKPILYKTTKEFLVQFGLRDVGELPSLKEFEEIRRLSSGDDETAAGQRAQAPEPADAVQPEPSSTAPSEPVDAVQPEPVETPAEPAEESDPSHGS